MVSDPRLQKFLDKQGRVKDWPAKPVMQRLVLDYLASKFVLGKIYNEKEVNAILGDYHTFNDPALLRRELIMKDLLDRTPDGNKYWKKEGTS